MQQVDFIHTGGGPVHVNTLKQIQNITPNATVIALYGSTEAEPVALQNLSTLDSETYARIATGAGLPAGIPVDIIELKIIKDMIEISIPPITQEAFEYLCLKENQVGEIVVSGPLVQTGYINKEDNLDTKFEVAGKIWPRTGDAGYLDEQGRIWLQGRCSAKIHFKEHILYPLAIEAAVMHSQITRAAFLQVHQLNFLVLEGEMLPDTIETQLKSVFPYLDKIIYLQNIPVDKRHHTKILYTELKKKLELILSTTMSY